MGNVCALEVAAVLTILEKLGEENIREELEKLEIIYEELQRDK